MNHSTAYNHPQYYHQFRIIQGILTKISFPYIFLVGFIGLITNTSTVLLLSKNFITKNLKNKWTLIALGMYKSSLESLMSLFINLKYNQMHRDQSLNFINIQQNSLVWFLFFST